MWAKAGRQRRCRGAASKRSGAGHGAERRRKFRLVLMDTHKALADSKTQETQQSSPPAEMSPEDFYYEGPYLVFTAAYHLKRGFCCNSDCRHCPYK